MIIFVEVVVGKSYIVGLECGIRKAGNWWQRQLGESKEEAAGSEVTHSLEMSLRVINDISWSVSTVTFFSISLCCKLANKQDFLKVARAMLLSPCPCPMLVLMNQFPVSGYLAEDVASLGMTVIQVPFGKFQTVCVSVIVSGNCTFRAWLVSSYCSDDCPQRNPESQSWTNQGRVVVISNNYLRITEVTII